MQRCNEALVQASRVVPRVWTGLVLNDNYKVGSLIEQGSTFELYDATQVSTNERVCLKILLPELAADAKVLALFLDEARIMSRLSHPGLLQYRACARDPQSDLSYIAMDFPGPRLSARLALLKSEPQDILAFGKRLAGALSVAHRAGLVHGHLSPESIALPKDGLSDAAILGFSLIRTQTSPVFDRAVVKAEYWAPEQAASSDNANSVGPWTDIYSLALVILAALSGQHGCHDVSLLPRKLRPGFSRMLRANPRRRFRRMDDVVELLDGVVPDSEPVTMNVERARPSMSAHLVAMAEILRLHSAHARTAMVGSLSRVGRWGRAQVSGQARAAIGSLSQLGKSPLTKMSVAAGGTKRAALAAAALLIVASPLLLQTSVPQVPAKARAASVVNLVQASDRTDMSALPVSNSDESASHDLVVASPDPVPEAKAAVLLPKRVTRTGARPVSARSARRQQTQPQTAVLTDAADSEAERTARLNAGQALSVVSSTERVLAETTEAERNPASENAAPSNPADQPAVETSAVNPPAAPLPQFVFPQLADLDAVPPVDQGTAAGWDAQHAEPETAPLVAQSAAESGGAASPPIGQGAAVAAEISSRQSPVQAIVSTAPTEKTMSTAERKLREWCKAQRRQCTFPTPR